MKRFYALIVTAALCFPSIGAWAWWQSIQQVAIAAGGAFSLTATANTSDNTSQTTYTFNAVNFGAADASRVIGVILSARTSVAGTVVSSMTIGGVSATKQISVNNTADDQEIWSAAVPSGTSGAVVVILSATGLRAGISVYSILGSSGGITASATGSSVATPPTATLTVPVGGATIGGLVSATGGSITITGSPAAFNNVDQNVTPNGGTVFAALHSDTSLSGSTVFTITPGAGTSNMTAVFASWGP